MISIMISKRSQWTGVHCSIMPEYADSLAFRSINRWRSSSCHPTFIFNDYTGETWVMRWASVVVSAWDSNVLHVTVEIGTVQELRLTNTNISANGKSSPQSMSIHSGKCALSYSNGNLGYYSWWQRVGCPDSPLHHRPLTLFFGSFFLSYQCRQDITYEPVCKQEVQQSIQGHHWCRLVRYLPYLSRAQTLPTPSFHLQPYQGSHGRRQASNHAGQLEHLIHIKCPLTLRLIVHSLFTCQLGPISYHRNSHRNLH